MRFKKTPGIKEIKILTFKTSNAFEKWLSKNHNKATATWLRFFKKDSGKTGITYKEAVDEALCYGWIDGQANKYDDESWIQKFTPRSAKSIWSKKNTENIEPQIIIQYNCNVKFIKLYSVNKCNRGS